MLCNISPNDWSLGKQVNFVFPRELNLDVSLNLVSGIIEILGNQLTVSLETSHKVLLSHAQKRVEEVLSSTIQWLPLGPFQLDWLRENGLYPGMKTLCHCGEVAIFRSLTKKKAELDSML